MIEDGVKAKEDYAPAKRVKVELRFEVAEGADAQDAIDKVAAIARTKVDQELGRAPRQVEKQPAPVEFKEKPKTKVEKPAAKEAEPLREPEFHAPDNDDPFSAGPADQPIIPDAMLMTKLSEANGRTKNTAAIKSLIFEYKPDDLAPDAEFKAVQIPVAKRKAFLLQLDKIPKLG